MRGVTETRENIKGVTTAAASMLLQSFLAVLKLEGKAQTLIIDLSLFVIC
jgi:hypothetical protein